MVLGAVWGPCVGPTLGAAIGAAAQGTNLLQSTLTMLAFGSGTAVSLAAFAYGSRRALAAKRAAWGARANIAKPLLGGVLLVVALLILSNLDKRLEAAALDAMPPWLVGFTTRF